MYDYDLLVLGSGPGGQKAAIAAAKLGRRVGIVDRRDMIGGVCINTGTVPSKTLREAVLYLTGLSQRDLYGSSYRVKEEITVSDLAARTQHVISRQTDVIRNQLARNRVAMITGTGRFADAHSVVGRRRLRARVQGHLRQDHHCRGYAPGPPGQRRLRRPDDRGLRRRHQPAGGAPQHGRGRRRRDRDGVRVQFAALGTKVTVVERRDRMLEFCDEEVVESLKYHLRDLSVAFRFGEEVAAVEKHQTAALCILKSGKKIVADTVMYSAGRQGQTDDLALERPGWRRTSAAGSWSTRTTAPRWTTSTRSVT